MEEDNFDRIAAEQEEQAILLDKGLIFNAGGKEYLISRTRLGQLDKMACLLIKLDIQKLELESEDWTRRFNEQKRIITPNMWLACRIVATAAVNHHRRSLFLFPLYTLKERYHVFKTACLFKYNLTPADLFKLVQIVLKAANLQDFTSSIALLSVNRTTAPQAIEGDQLD